MYLNSLLKLWLIFCHYQQKIQKMSHFWQGLNMIGRQMTPYFLISLSSIRWYISFFHFRTFINHFYGVPIRTMLWALVCNTHLHTKDNIFKPVKIYILSLQKIYYIEFLVYYMSYSQFDTNLAPIPWTIATYLNILQGKKQLLRVFGENRCSEKFAK